MRGRSGWFATSATARIPFFALLPGIAAGMAPDDAARADDGTPSLPYGEEWFTIP